MRSIKISHEVKTIYSKKVKIGREIDEIVPEISIPICSMIEVSSIHLLCRNSRKTLPPICISVGVSICKTAKFFLISQRNSSLRPNTRILSEYVWCILCWLRAIIWWPETTVSLRVLLQGWEIPILHLTWTSLRIDDMFLRCPCTSSIYEWGNTRYK